MDRKRSEALMEWMSEMGKEVAFYTKKREDNEEGFS